jgi:hypothetical protein
VSAPSSATAHSPCRMSRKLNTNVLPDGGAVLLLAEG